MKRKSGIILSCLLMIMLYTGIVVQADNFPVTIKDDLDSRDLPKGYTNLQYQADAVVEGFNKLMKHNGFILADVVGLGKTVVASRIIKRYIAKNGFNTGS